MLSHRKAVATYMSQTQQSLWNVVILDIFCSRFVGKVTVDYDAKKTAHLPLAKDPFKWNIFFLAQLFT